MFSGRPHVDIVRGNIEHVSLARGKSAWLMKAQGPKHSSVTDTPLLEPELLSWATGSTVDPLGGFDQYVEAAELYAFLAR